MTLMEDKVSTLTCWKSLNKVINKVQAEVEEIVSLVLARMPNLKYGLFRRNLNLSYIHKRVCKVFLMWKP